MYSTKNEAQCKLRTLGVYHASMLVHQLLTTALGACGGLEGIGEHSLLSFHFPVNLKMPYKN